MAADTSTDADLNEVAETPSDGEILLNLIFSMKVRGSVLRVCCWRRWRFLGWAISTGWLYG
jgi:hypothetical protein